jgi:hypothetical protein
MADDGKGAAGAATANRITRTASTLPMVVVGVKAGNGAYGTRKTAKTLALNLPMKELGENRRRSRACPGHQ